MKNKLCATLATATLGLLGTVAAQAAATIVIVNTNAAGVGFNDPTPAAPVGGNPGTTLGQQRLNAFVYAADLWGATVTSPVPIFIDAAFIPLACTANAGTLGSAGSTFLLAGLDPPGKPDRIYGMALTDKIEGFDVGPGLPDIQARFNSDLGMNANCLPNSGWYLGLDTKHGTRTDLVTVLLHEFGHGLGFQTFTSGLTGAQRTVSGVPFPSVWDDFIRDNGTGLNWVQMTNAQRQASAINTGKLVWTGPGVTATWPGVLSGAPLLTLSGPAAGTAAGNYDIGRASFGARLSASGTAGDIMPIIPDSPGVEGCAPFTALNKLAVSGNVALISRGTCGFAVKAKNAQDAGAIGVIIQDNVAAAAPPGLGGTDDTVIIPTVSVTQAVGVKIRSALAKRSRNRSGVIGNLTTDPTRISGIDGGYVQLYSPNPFQSGSSVSHYDITNFPNQHMEPAINGDLTHDLIPPNDMTFTLLKDIGW